MLREIPSTTDPEVFSDWLHKIVNPDQVSDTRAVVSNIGGGLLHFAEVTFSGMSAGEVLSKHYRRGPTGRGAHFDVYQSDVARRYPWVAVYNFTGSASVRVANLSEELADDYFQRFPIRTEEAIEVVDEYSARVMSDPASVISVGKIGAGSGLVIPQSAEGPHIIHDIVPDDPGNPGQFLKLVVPEPSNPEFQDRFLSKGYLQLGDYVDLSLTQSPQNNC